MYKESYSSRTILAADSYIDVTIIPVCYQMHVLLNMYVFHKY